MKLQKKMALCTYKKIYKSIGKNFQYIIRVLSPTMVRQGTQLSNAQGLHQSITVDGHPHTPRVDQTRTVDDWYDEGVPRTQSQ